MRITQYPGTERIVVQPFTVYDIKEDGIWHVERLKVTTVVSTIRVRYLIFAPKKFLAILRTDAVVSANIVKLTQVLHFVQLTVRIMTQRPVSEGYTSFVFVICSLRVMSPVKVCTKISNY